MSTAGSSAGTCEQASPCTPDRAINVVGRPGDEVLIEPGEYQLARPLVAMGITVRGVAGQPRPRLHESGTGATTVSTGSGSGFTYSATTLVLDQGASAAHLGLYQSAGTGTALNMQKTDAEDVVAVANGGSGTAVLIQGGSDLFPGRARLRDSVAYANGSTGDAVSVGGLGVEMRNVTALAPGAAGAALDVRGSAFCAQSFCPGALPARVTARNVILDGGLADAHITASGGYGTFAELRIGHSNFRAPSVVMDGTGSLESLGDNQSAEPLLRDPVNGDFRQSAGSPTIDGGVEDEETGTRDLDGDERTLGASPDIGADEYVPPAHTPGDPSPSTGMPSTGAGAQTSALATPSATPSTDITPPSVAVSPKVAVSSTGVVRIKLGPASEPAVGMIRIVSAGKIRRPGGKAKSIVLGGKLLEMTGPRGKTVAMKLTKANFRLLKQRRRLRVTVRVTLTDAAGNTATRTVTATLRSPR